MPRVAPIARRRLLLARSRLERVSALRDWRGVSAPAITRLNEHYRPALALAELVLRNLSLSEEDFVTAAFTAAMRKHGETIRPQVGDYSLDRGGRLTLPPDIGWLHGDRCLAVVDAKYKAIDDGEMRHDDAYQMLAYCTAYGLDRGYLVDAKDSATEPRTQVVRDGEQRIVVRALDVEFEPRRHPADGIARSVVGGYGLALSSLGAWSLAGGVVSSNLLSKGAR
jgi:5-methylcytosine-specific restriction enzyme subunit McrC